MYAKSILFGSSCSEDMSAMVIFLAISNSCGDLFFPSEYGINCVDVGPSDLFPFSLLSIPSLTIDVAADDSSF